MRSCVLTILLVIIGVVPAHPQTPSGPAKAADVRGRAEQRAGSNPDAHWAPLRSGDPVSSDSAVRTAAGSAVLLALPDGHVLRIGENTMLDLKELGRNGSFSFSLLRGRVWSFVDKAKKPARYEVETPSTILGVSGTLFSVAHDPRNDETDVSVDDGTVHLRQGQTTKGVTAGLQLRVLRNQLDQATPQKHTKATQAMWKAIRAEKWHEPNGAGRLDQQVEERTRGVQQERQNEKRQDPPRAPRPEPARGRGRRGI